mmetsp:Transcript_11527/g.26727  ORF Transcript_11527/g.26727 Transcript_11527/m.26727 type:complete len:422 (+) Transcript_11527:109-1374(+)|eukprot:CAMPEP_0201203840 /NCGR_PEP_ID=MMETSP0851-20130426/167831_1 /ASSEMBLY_ACC=CAM_ASM_000631 /TAXON_ID=183588 /ORGANISM="Pseudo-nitzschia fraudulenta, Strain WWA7" /LENGTH=421 /DNA_ID=CAMNT_0047491873 /DNA_START=108 /DNA_END=1373 /DNA_ORIENTATION=-
MGKTFWFIVKAALSSAVSGFTAHKLAASATTTQQLSRPARFSLTGLASLAGLVYYSRVWVQDYYFDWSYRDNRDLTGRVAVVTGGTADGLGYAAAEILYRQGATVIVTVRTKEKGETAVRLLRASATPGGDDGENDGRASYVICDFLSESSVRNCAAEIKRKTSEHGIDFLVLNAGISGGKATKQSGSNDDSAGEEEREKATKSAVAGVWMTNHVGPWIFARELMPSLVRAARSNPNEHPRVVWVSSGAHKRSAIDWVNPFYPAKTFAGVTFSSYGQSKLANIMHAREYQKRVREMLLRNEGAASGGANATATTDVKCFALTPGAVLTNIIPKVSFLYPLFWVIMRSPEMGAQVIKMACLDNDLKGGEYLSNCQVKESLGAGGCSTDEEQWKRLWELTEKQVEEKAYERFLESLDANKKTD